MAGSSRPRVSSTFKVALLAGAVLLPTCALANDANVVLYNQHTPKRARLNSRSSATLRMSGAMSRLRPSYSSSNMALRIFGRRPFTSKVPKLMVEAEFASFRNRESLSSVQRSHASQSGALRRV